MRASAFSGGSKTLRLSRIKFGLLFVTTGILVYWVMQNDLFLPLRITVGYAAHAPKGLTAYIDTGHGFTEKETLLFTGSRFSADRRATRVWSGPPILNLRLDPGYRPRTIILNSLCLDSLFRSTCWSAQELAGKLKPANDIGGAVLRDGGLYITRDGPDPYLVYQGGFAERYVEHARVRNWVAVPVAFLLPVLLMLAWSWSAPRIVELGRRFGQASIRMTRWQGLGVFVLLSLITTGNWLQLDDAGIPVWTALLVFVVVVTIPGAIGVEPRPLKTFFQGIRGDGYPAAVAAILSAAFPVFALLALTWEQEFPYVGDQHFHLDIDRATYYFVRDHLWELSGILLTLVFCMLLGWVRIWLLAAFMFFLAWSYTEVAPHYLVRYPGAGRFLVAPFFHLAENYGWNSMLNAARLANAFGILAWLLVLRPLIVRRWPDWSIAPVAAAFFFQAEVAYYFTSSYLEPWSLIFVLLAIEHHMRFGEEPARTGTAMLMIGFAAVIKEAAIFMLPIIWLSGRPWRFGPRQVLITVVTGVAAAAPFLVYYAIRSHAGERPFRMVEPDQFITIDKLVETYYQLDFHYGWGGLLLSTVLLSWLVFNVFGGTRRASALMLLGGILFYQAFNYLEATSLGYAGYTRYYLFPYLLLCAGLLFLQRHNERHRGSVIAATAVAVSIALNAQVLFPYYAKTRQHDAVRNFTEHYDAPVFMPIRTLVDKAAISGALRENERITINNPLAWGMPSIGLNYPDLSRRYKLVVEENVDCVCRPEKSVILQPFVFMGGLNSHLRVPETRRARQQFPKKRFYSIWVDRNNQRSACLKSMGASCSSVFEVREQSELVGILGVL